MDIDEAAAATTTTTEEEEEDCPTTPKPTQWRSATNANANATNALSLSSLSGISDDYSLTTPDCEMEMMERTCIFQDFNDFV